MLMLLYLAGALGTVDSASLSQDEWLRQFDVSLPGCTLKKQVDILALIKQVSNRVMFFSNQMLLIAHVKPCISYHVHLYHRNFQKKRTNRYNTVTQLM